MITGGQELVRETRRIVDALKGGPHIFNLGHGITPEADPENVHLLLADDPRLTGCRVMRQASRCVFWER
jgi:hypothetical protein